MPQPPIGFDIGTSFCTIACFRDGKPQAVLGPERERRIPSVIAFTDGEPRVGTAALSTAPGSHTTVASILRIMGKRASDPFVQANKKFWPFRLVSDNDKIRLLVDRKNESELYSPEEVLAILLQHLKRAAEAHVGCPVKDVVVTCAGAATLRHRQALRDAGKIVGLNVLHVVSAPVAAVLADSISKGTSRDCNVLVVNLGGGASNFSIVTVSGSTFEVRSSSGDANLGGDDYDNALLAHCADKILKKTKHDVLADKHALQLLRSACEKAKIALSASSEAHIKVDDLGDKSSFKTSMKRSEFEDICAGPLSSLNHLLEKALIDGAFNRTQIDEILLVGGATHTQKVSTTLQTFFGKKPILASPDESPAFGAAIQAAILASEPHPSVQKWEVHEALPHNIGVETRRGILDPTMKRAQVIPGKEELVLTTSTEGQTTMSIRVFEGEGGLSKDNELVGELDLTGIPAAAQGASEVRVILSVSADRAVSISATIQGSDKTLTACLSDQVGMTEGQIERAGKKVQQTLDSDFDTGDKRKDLPVRKGGK